jgi:hypothetical protein
VAVSVWPEVERDGVAAETYPGEAREIADLASRECLAGLVGALPPLASVEEAVASFSIARRLRPELTPPEELSNLANLWAQRLWANEPTAPRRREIRRFLEIATWGGTGATNAAGSLAGQWELSYRQGEVSRAEAVAGIESAARAAPADASIIFRMATVEMLETRKADPAARAAGHARARAVLVRALAPGTLPRSEEIGSRLFRAEIELAAGDGAAAGEALEVPPTYLEENDALTAQVLLVRSLLVVRSDPARALALLRQAAAADAKHASFKELADALEKATSEPERVAVERRLREISESWEP